MHFRFIKEATVILVLAAVSAVLYNSSSADGLDIVYKPLEMPTGNIINLSGLDRLIRLQKAVLIDVRTEIEFNEGHIPGARNLPFKSPRDRKIVFAKQFDPKQVFIFYCSNPACTQAERLAGEFNLMGFTNTILFEDGWEAWLEADLAIEKM